MEKESIGLWEHSLGVGVAANMIARKLGLPECEEIATAGLLHDIGKVIISQKCPESEAMVRVVVRDKKNSMRDAEQEIFGTDHAEIGGWLSTCWFLPDKLSEPIAFHHNVELAENHRVKTAVVHLADILIKASGFGDSGDPYVPRIQDAAWNILKLTDEQLQELVDELADKLVEVKNFSLEMQA